MQNQKMTFLRTLVIVVLVTAATSFVSAQGTGPLPLSEQVATKVDEYMKAVVEVDGFSGTILVARDGKPIVSRGYGLASVELNVPNTPKTVFRLGSVTKQFTGMAIAMLQEKGKLKVENPICSYISDCPEIWKPITVNHLLRHTSGITNYTAFPDFAKTTIIPVTTSEMTDRIKKEPLEFVPGEKMSYSNSGYFLLGVIIEKVSEKKYAEFLQDNIFTPLGMDQTGYDDPVRVIMNRAAGYQKRGGAVVNASYMDMSVPYAAGSLYSTTEDLLRWDQALYTEKLVSQKGLDAIFAPEKGESGYGFGWSIGKRFDRRTIGHGGGIYGFATQISRFPADRVTVIVLSNIQGAAAGPIANNLAAIAFGAPYELPKERKEIAVDPKILEQYVGEYTIGTSIVIAVTLESGKLLAQVGGQSKITLAPETETVFFSRDVNLTLTFVKDAGGKVTGFNLRQGGSDNPAEKIK